MISVIVTNYNYGNYLGRCIRSLLEQSVPKSQYEIIVVDDCSTDHSRQVIQSFSGYIRPVFNETNLGLGATCNVGLKMAVGRFAVRVDADDYVHHDFLLVSQLYLTQNYETCDAVALDYVEVDEDERVLSRRCSKAEPIACGITYKIDALTKIGLYNDKLRIHEDKELRNRFEEAGLRLHHLNLPLYRYKKHSSSLTSNYY